MVVVMQVLGVMVLRRVQVVPTQVVVEVEVELTPAKLVFQDLVVQEL